MQWRDVLPLHSKYLHFYIHLNFSSWPFARVWTSDVAGGTLRDRGRYQRVNETDLGEDEGQQLNERTTTSEDGRAPITTDGPAEEDDLLPKPHPGSCGSMCSVGHVAVHIGFLFWFTVVIAIAMALLVPTYNRITASEATLTHKPYPIDTVSSSLSPAPSSNEDYILDPDWDFDAEPQLREFDWVITDIELNPDGVFRPMMVINGQFPGPLIEVNEGDSLRFIVHNRAQNSTSFHWHGLYQNGTNHMDGTVGVTTCAIASGFDFAYEFKVERQSGTYWYHGHQGLQGSDGLLGPFVIHSKDEKQNQPLQYDTDRIVMIQDHYHDLSGALMMQYLQSGNENEEPVPESSLINGKNVRDCDNFIGRRCDNSTTSRWTMDLNPAQSHRLRFINVGAFAEFQIQIDEHEFAVTEVDGTDVEPAYYHRLNINPAQRYSIVLPPKSEGFKDGYWLRARMVTSCFSEKNPNLDPEIRGIIRYQGSSSSSLDQEPSSKDWDDTVEVWCKDMNTTELIPVEKIRAPDPDAFFYIRSNFEIGNWRLSRGYFNTSSWRADAHSTLLQRSIDGLSSSNTTFHPLSSSSSPFVNTLAFEPSHELVIQSSGIKVIDLAIQNFDDGNHPMHLHGHKFFVLASGKGHFNASAVYPTLDLSNPLRRDTASLEAYSWLLIRFIADNPGVWAFHCHLAWHAEAGLLMNFLTCTDVLSGWKVPDTVKELCDRPGLEKGMAPKDEIWYGTGIGDEER